MKHPFRIAHTYDIGAFVTMKALLEGSGIETLDLAVGGHVSIAGAEIGYFVEVVPDDQSRARQLLEENGYADFLLEP